MGSEMGYPTIAQCFIEKGAGIECKEKIETNSSLYSCEKSHFQIIQLLIAKGSILKQNKKMEIKQLLYIMHVKMFIFQLLIISLKKELKLKQNIMSKNPSEYCVFKWSSLNCIISCLKMSQY